MFDLFRLKDALVQYKQDFVFKQWKDEKYKWVAIKSFKDNWDINADDFAGMLSKSLSPVGNLLNTDQYHPMDMIIKFAGIAPNEVRAMFIALTDENRDFVERVEDFESMSTLLLEKYGNGDKQHYQYENAITTYLWLLNPDKYYIYDFSVVKAAADELGSNYLFKKDAYRENLKHYLDFYNEVCAYIKTDAELIELFKSQLTDDCYSDPEYRTLAMDVCSYISQHVSEINVLRYEPYSPKISTETWIKLLHDRSVFTESSLEIMKRMKDYGGQATCSQLASKYGETKNFYNVGSVSLAHRVANATNCPLYHEEGEEQVKWWPILYTGKDADKDDKGSFIWKLRDELAAALDSVDLSEVKLYAVPSPSRYWWLNANPKIWSLSNMAVGETHSYSLYNENGNKRMIFQNFLDVKAGDMVIGYESNPGKQIIAICRITAGSDGEKILFEKLEGLPSPIRYEDLKNSPEFKETEFYKIRTGSLFKLTKDQYNFIIDRIREENPKPDDEQKHEEYMKSRFLEQVYITEKQYDELVSVLKSKKNLILKGAPGVGKTYAARRLAYSMMGEVDDSRIGFVQFHQNYSYENFMMGFRPSEKGFELKNGVFVRFCLQAANQPDKDFFFIIDEINRGNMSKIFGELLMMIESDYRGVKTTLAYDEIPFSVPKNLYIIGMMNTADRSLAMIDYALRRRFGFATFEPAFDSVGFKTYQKGLGNETFDALIKEIKALNEAIEKDKSLGKGFVIGHSYFCNWKECTKAKMLDVVKHDIIPMLEEYWYDNDKSLQTWSTRLLKVVDPREAE